MKGGGGRPAGRPDEILNRHAAHLNVRSVEGVIEQAPREPHLLLAPPSLSIAGRLAGPSRRRRASCPDPATAGRKRRSRRQGCPYAHTSRAMQCRLPVQYVKYRDLASILLAERRSARCGVALKGAIERGAKWRQLGRQ